MISLKNYYFEILLLELKRYQNKFRKYKSFIKIVILLSSTNDCLVCLVEILLSNDVTILSDCFHTCLLTNTGNIGSTDLIRSTDVLLKIDILRKVHFACNSGKNKSFLSSIGKWEFYFSIKSSWTK